MSFPTSSDRYMKIDDEKIHYRLFINENSLKTICILPSFSFESSIYANLMRELKEKGFTVLCVDYLGRGFSSSASNDKYGIELDTEIILKLLIGLSYQKYDLIGFSYGCSVASSIVARSPSIFDSVTFCSPLFNDQGDVSPSQYFFFSTPYIGPVIYKIVSTFVMPKLLSDSIVLHNEEEKQKYIDCAMKHVNSRYYDISRSLSYYEYRKVKKELLKIMGTGVKTSIILGENDTLTDLNDSTSFWESWLPDAKIKIFKNCGHHIFIDKLDELVEHVFTFLT